MAISIVDWNHELSCTEIDKVMGVQITTLTELHTRGTYLATIPPGTSIKPHYHKQGDEEYHILKGKGIIRLLPVSQGSKDFQMVCKHVSASCSFVIHANMVHELINNSDEPLVLLFNCPLSHLKDDRFIIDSLEKIINEKWYHSN